MFICNISCGQYLKCLMFDATHLSKQPIDQLVYPCIKFCNQSNQNHELSHRCHELITVFDFKDISLGIVHACMHTYT